MKKKIGSILGILIVLVAVFAYAHIAKTHCIFDKDIDMSEYKDTSIYVNGEFIQRFTSVEDHLDGISIKCRITGEAQNITLKYYLTEVDTGLQVAEGCTTGDQIKNSKFYEFSFDTVEGCKDKEFEFKIIAEGEDEENSINFCYMSDCQEGTSLIFNGEEIEGTMALKTVTNRFDLETFCVLLIFIIYIWAFMKFLYKLFK